MARIVTYEINGIEGGISPLQYKAGANQYMMAYGIDPDYPNLQSSGIRTAGLISPVPMTKFSGTEITGTPNWIITQPKTTNSFVYASDGKLHSFNSSLVMRTSDEASTSLPISITGGAGNGAVYYNNFIYLAEASDISQYGGMDQAASIAKTENVWTGSKFSKTGLSNTAYPTMRGVIMPNHSMHLHGDNAVYICDVLPTGAASGASGRGTLHRLKTKRTTIDGDTDDSSGYNVLDLPYGFYPSDIESYGTDLLIAAFQTTDTTINQGNAKLFLWDITADSWYREIYVPDPLVTAIVNVNGIPIIYSGNVNNGFRVSAYLGGNTVTPLKFFEEGNPPFAGAVDAFMTRAVFGTGGTFPENVISVFALGTKIPDLEQSVLHNIIRATQLPNSATVGTVASLKYVQQASGIIPRLVVGWADGAGTNGLDKYSSTATLNSLFKTSLFVPGGQFSLLEIEIPFSNPITSTVSIIPKVYYDDENTAVTLATINNTNYASQEKVFYKRPELAVNGRKNFSLQLGIAGTMTWAISFPIRITVEIYDDESN